MVRVLRPDTPGARARSAYDLYMRASTLDEDPSTFDEAEALYKKAIDLDPQLADKFVGMYVNELTLAYDGTRFVGWQRQANVVTIQQVMEDAAFFPITSPVQANYHAEQVHNAVYVEAIQNFDPANVWLSADKQGG